MFQPTQAEVEVVPISDDEENSFTTPKHHQKRLKTQDQHQYQLSTPSLILLDDSSSASKSHKSATPSNVPDTPFSVLSKYTRHPIIRCSGVDRHTCLESDDEAGKCMEQKDKWKNKGICTSFNARMDLETSPNFSVSDRNLENGAISADLGAEKCSENTRILNSTTEVDKVVHSNVYDEAGHQTESCSKYGIRFSDCGVQLDQCLKLLVKEKQVGNETMTTSLDDCLESSPSVVSWTRQIGCSKSKDACTSISLEDCTRQMPPFHDKDHEKENVRLDTVAAAICKPKGRGRGEAFAENKQNKADKATNQKKLQAEKKRLMEEKRCRKQEEKLLKEALKAQAAKSRQLEKARKRWEKESQKYILAEIDARIVQLGSIGGHLLTRFGEKGLKFNISSNAIEKSIVWKMTAPDEISQLSSIRTDVPYVLLIFGDEEFCKAASDGSLMDQILSVQRHYPSYTICCLTNRLMSSINKRKQDKYRGRKHASDCQLLSIEEAFAKLTVHFANVHTRQCADEAELADHVVGLTINLAKCRFREKLSSLSVNANGGNVPKDCMDRDLIMKNPWLKALVSIPKVQPRFAVSIFKKYPTMKSLLSVYFDPTKSVLEKEFLLKDLTMDGIRLGEVCSKRVYRVLMARNGSIKTDDVENGADYFSKQ